MLRLHPSFHKLHLVTLLNLQTDIMNDLLHRSITHWMSELLRKHHVAKQNLNMITLGNVLAHSITLRSKGWRMYPVVIKRRQAAHLPVEQPMKFEFFVNLKTAKQIGLTPPNVLVRAD